MSVIKLTDAEITSNAGTPWVGAGYYELLHQNAIHYPLNGIDLDSRRYSHRCLGQRDIVINRIMEDYLRPHRAQAKAYLSPTSHGCPTAQVKSLNRDFGIDLELASKMLETEWNVDEAASFMQYIVKLPDPEPSAASATPWYHCRNRTTTAYRTFPSLDEFVYGLVQRHFLEIDPSLQALMKFFKRYLDRSRQSATAVWKEDVGEHLKKLKRNMEVQHGFHLYSGWGSQYSVPEHFNPLFFIDPYILAISPSDVPKHLNEIVLLFMRLRSIGHLERLKPEMHNLDCVRRGRARRSRSQPAPGAWCSVVWKTRYILFPRRRLSELDKLSRRRSLSRTHIRAMFRDKPKVVPQAHPRRRHDKPRVWCRNCTDEGHLTQNCPSGCGHCNSREHDAESCPVDPLNRCKCEPFPQFHTAFNCPVRCSRRCGNPYPPGHFKHKNAMLCSRRCCMCGLLGHAGRKCNLKKCRCGRPHLTQDCRWKVECPANGCSHYLCTRHCRECGRPRGQEEYFVIMTCRECLQNSHPVAPKADE